MQRRKEICVEPDIIGKRDKANDVAFYFKQFLLKFK